MLVAFSITPIGHLGAGEEAHTTPEEQRPAGGSVSSAVADVVRLVRESGLPNETNAMFTNVEGEWDEVMPLIRRCMDRVLEGAPRASVVIKIDERPGHTGRLRGKVESIERHLAEG